MRRRLLPVVLVLCTGCAAQEEQLRPAAAPTTPEPWSGSTTETAAPLEKEPAAAPRPRLSRTVTLGQDDYSPAPSRPAQAQGNNGTTIVNNNIVVQSPPAIYGGYGGYSYGYGGYGGRTVIGDGRTGVGAPSRGPWAPSGWEGAQRTATPGQTPGVGGNWAPPPSTGPAPMR